ncbi:MAG: hypothetical protein V3T17_00540 [Pseudomonadales bacterium]
MLDYFCYISESKVDQLYEQINKYSSSELKIEREVSNEKCVKPAISNILKIFSVEASFAKKDRVVCSGVKHKATMQKLKDVVENITTMDKLRDLRSESVFLESLDSVFYTFEGKFSVVDVDERFSFMESKIKPSLKLRLVCSLSNFSDMAFSDGKYVPHSANYSFFYNSLKVQFKSILMVQGLENGTIIGSPIFLALKPVGNLDL